MSRTDWAEPAAAGHASLEVEEPVAAAEADADAGEQLVEAAERRKRKAAPAADAAGERPPTRRRARRKAAPAAGDAAAPEDLPGDSALVGVSAGRPPVWTPWGITAATLAALVLIATVIGAVRAPAAQRVGQIRPAWIAGPQVSQAEFMRWIGIFPHRDRLAEPNAWVLDRLVEHLRALPGVAEVRQVRLVHEPAADRRRLVRVAEVQLGLRTPFLPGMLADGRRVWIDREGHILPGVLPAPAARRPVVRQIEAGGRAGVAEAIALWERIEGQIEPGLVTDVLLADRLDEVGTRGIVLRTRLGARLVWGRPGEERFGVDPDGKARELVRTVRGQGDLNRIAEINVRFKEAFYTLRDAPGAQVPAQQAGR